MLLAKTLSDNWPVAMSVAGDLLDALELRSVGLHRARQLDPQSKAHVETMAWNTEMDMTRGILTIMRKLQPDDEVLEILWQRLNHCPILVLAGPDPAGRQPGGATK